MKTKLKKWKKVSSKVIFRNYYFELFKDVVRLPNGKKHDYFVNHKKGRAVTILPVDKKGHILLSKEFRYPVGKVIYQSIGGGVDKKEIPLHAAKRELQEETGYQAKKFILLGTFYGNPGRSGTVFYAYTARGLKAGQPDPEDAEFLENGFLSPSRIDSMIKKGEIKEPYFMAAWLLYKLKRK